MVKFRLTNYEFLVLSDIVPQVISKLYFQINPLVGTSLK